MDLLKLLQEGDAMGLEMEKAREALEQAKAAVEHAKERFELTKGYFEQVLAQADEAGIPKAKFKKLLEERTAALWSSGLLPSSEDKPAKAPKATRAPKKPKGEAQEAAVDFDRETNADDAIPASII